VILLDTNILSELMRPSPASQVVRWLDSYPESDVWISAMTVAEIRMGIALLPEGKREKLLVDLAEQTFEEDFPGQCLPFDCDAARKYAEIVVERNRKGRPISVEDAQIAAIALTAGLRLATRNTKDFLDIEGLGLINPWVES